MTVPENNRAPCIGGPADGQFISATDGPEVRVVAKTQRAPSSRLDALYTPAASTASTYIREALRMNEGSVVREYVFYRHEDTSPHAALMLLVAGYLQGRW